MSCFAPTVGRNGFECHLGSKSWHGCLVNLCTQIWRLYCLLIRVNNSDWVYLLFAAIQSVTSRSPLFDGLDYLSTPENVSVSLSQAPPGTPLYLWVNVEVQPFGPYGSPRVSVIEQKVIVISINFHNNNN